MRSVVVGGYSYGRVGLVVALFLVNLWRRDYISRSSSSSNPCVLLVMCSNKQLCVKHAFTLFGAQCVGVTAGFQVSLCSAQWRHRRGLWDFTVSTLSILGLPLPPFESQFKFHRSWGKCTKMELTGFIHCNPVFLSVSFIVKNFILLAIPQTELADQFAFHHILVPLLQPCIIVIRVTRTLG